MAGKIKSAAVDVVEQNPMLTNALGQIEKAFGKGSIMKLSDTAGTQVSGIPTGALSLDLALGGYGFPRGRVVELFGPESSGKTTLALHVIANAQRQGGIADPHLGERRLPPAQRPARRHVGDRPPAGRRVPEAVLHG